MAILPATLALTKFFVAWCLKKFFKGAIRIKVLVLVVLYRRETVE